MAGESEMRMFHVDADGRHKSDGMTGRLVRLLWAWLRFAVWRLMTMTAEFLSPSRLGTALRPRRRKRPRAGPMPPGGDRLDRFN